MSTDQAPTPGGVAEQWVVVVSDVHIGDGGPTCWYQPDVHERHLVALLDWVVTNAGRIRELVLLGDVVDLWTYPFEQRPPTFTDIVAANPAVFGFDGALSRVLDALHGAVTWVPGNHDMGITPEEAAQVRSRRGHRLRLIDDLTYQPLLPDRRLLMSHGHAHTLFNAVDDRSQWGSIPIGHFVTRAVAEHWARNLPPGQTVADLAGQGAPSGLDLRGMSSALRGTSGAGVVGVLLDFLDGALDVSPTDPIAMPDGSTATLGDARIAYSDLWSRWSERSGGGPIGAIEAARAADGDATEQLGWFAQAEAVRSGADLVVMGHTHGAVSGLRNSMVGYLNTGFECPSSADVATKPMTFGVVDIGGAEISAEIWRVADRDGGIVCRPEPAPAEVIARYGTMDFSCYIEIDNRDGDDDLHLVAATATVGRFVHDPPVVVERGTRERIWVRDDLGISGSAAVLRYRSEAGRTVGCAVSCPTGFRRNRVAADHSFVARAGSASWGRPGRVRWFGHPLFVRLR